MKTFAKVIGCAAGLAVITALFLYELPRIEKIGR